MSSTDPHIPPEEPFNPYAAPKAEGEPPLLFLGDDLVECEAIRKAHLAHEASIKSIGALHYFGVFFSVLGVLAFATVGLGADSGMAAIGAALATVFYLGIGALNAALGYGLRSFQSWARWTEVAFNSLGFAFVVLITVGAIVVRVWPVVAIYLFFVLIQSCVLYLLLSRKASVIFSSRYKEIVERTPYLKYRTSALVKIAVIIFVAFLVFAVISTVITSRP